MKFTDIIYRAITPTSSAAAAATPAFYLFVAKVRTLSVPETECSAIEDVRQRCWLVFPLRYKWAARPLAVRGWKGGREGEQLKGICAGLCRCLFAHGN